ncbi:hypothetical protein DFJ73DRAFT_880686, partial [Zopfochytrium polystomum]
MVQACFQPWIVMHHATATVVWRTARLSAAVVAFAGRAAVRGPAATVPLLLNTIGCSSHSCRCRRASTVEKEPPRTLPLTTGETAVEVAAAAVAAASVAAASMVGVEATVLVTHDVGKALSNSLQQPQPPPVKIALFPAGSRWTLASACRIIPHRHRPREPRWQGFRVYLQRTLQTR